MEAAESPGFHRGSSVQLIVNADDFGLSPGINDGILTAHARGIVTSASLMVRQRGVRDAIDRAKAFPQLGIGLHVDLGEWIYRHGEWEEVYRFIDWEDVTAIEREVRQQIQTFLEIVGRKPTHLDSHQHVHRQEPIRTCIVACGTELGIPVRHNVEAIRYCGDFYGQGRDGQSWPNAIQVPGLLETLAQLSPGMTELACHPGLDEDLPTMYVHERRTEVATLCDPRVRTLIDERKFELISFAEVMNQI